jgi:hypothetical protein
MIARAATAVLLVAGACVGAAAGVRLDLLDETWQVAGTLIAVVAGVLVATLLTHESGQAESVPQPMPQPQRPTPAPAPATAPAETPSAQQQTARIVLDVDTPSTGGQWWTQSNATPRASNGDAPRPATQPRDLVGYVDTARVVQCPRCGSFQIDVTRVAGGFSFRCRTDEHAWQWRPGRAWPATVVVSRRRNL